MSDTTGEAPDAPALAPGTYELTKRLEVSDDGIARFVDMPDGPDAEYVKGFWHKTRSQVRMIEPGQTPVSEGMVEAAARQLYGGPVHRFKAEGDDLIEYTVTWDEVVGKVGEAERDAYLGQARRILSAALAGRTVVELPDPGRREDECGVDAGFWHLKEPGPRSEVADIMSYAIDGTPCVYTGPGPDYAYTVAAMRERCLAGLAACDDAERLAAESGKDGEPRGE